MSTALEKTVRQAEQDDSVRAMVICGKGRCFAGGADIQEFKKFHSVEKFGEFYLLCASYMYIQCLYTRDRFGCT